MKNIIFFFFVPLLILCAGCGGDESGSLNLNFKATYGSEPLVMFNEMEYNDSEIRIAQSDFFISEITLVGDEGEVELEEINFIDFTSQNIDVESANRGIDLDYPEVPAGSYSQLRFSIGVPASMNSQVPTDFSSSSPLSNSGYYWSAWDSYIFAKLQGNLETDEPGEFDLGWFFHTGRDDLLRTIEVPINISIDEDGSQTVSISLDHKKLFSTGGDSYFNIEENPANHDPTNIGALNVIVDNYQSAISAE